MNNELLKCKARGLKDGEWIKGFYLYLMTIEGKKHYICTGIMDETGLYPSIYKYEIDPKTVCRSSGCYDITGKLIYEGDLIESHQGTQVLDITMVIKYGTYKAYCPADDAFMTNVGFYVETNDYPQMPMGPTEEYAKVIGNVFDNPELQLL